MDSSNLELVRTEIEILKICQHPFIIKLYDVFENIDYIYIIMEYCSGRDLLSCIKKIIRCERRKISRNYL